MPIGHEIVGNGPEGVIVLHGWVTDHTAFAPTYPYLDTDTFTYAFLDYRGYGRSRDQAGEHTIAEIGGDALALADSLGWDRFHVLGHSMGGQAAQWVASQAPDRVKCVVAVTPVPASGVPLEGDFLTLFESAADTHGSRGTIVHITTGSRLDGTWQHYITQQSVATTTRDAFADYLRAWTRTDFSAQAQGCTVPIKVLVGENDPAINADVVNATIMKHFADAELEVLHNAGHYPMLEIPVYFATTCQEFMRRHK